MSRFYWCPENNRAVFGLLFFIAVMFSLTLIANPGFFSHDELERADYVSRYGFLHYLTVHVMPQPGNDFGVPVRPVSFFIQGVVSLFLPTYPFLIHLVDVLIHASVAVMLFVITLKLHGNRQFAWFGALIFIASPLATFSTGWSAALMDRLYILFGLVALVAAHSYISQQRGRTSLLAIFIASTLAMWSKETALILPAVLIIYPLFSLESVKNKRLWISFLVWSLPVLLFLLYRAPALINTFSGQVATAYPPSLENVPENIVTYFIYPFLSFLTEPHLWSISSKLSIWAAVFAHLSLLVILGYAFSYRVVLAYLLGYVIFLIPVLLIPTKGAHYLYGSGLVLSLAIGALLTLNWKRGRKILIAIPIGLLIVSVLHAVMIQRYFYKTGSCMNSLAMTMESSYLADGGPEIMSILVEPSAPGHVLHRFAHNKVMIGSYFPVAFQVVDWDMRGDNKTHYLFNSDCVVYKQSVVDLKIINWGPQSTVVDMIPGLQPDGSAGIWIQVSGALGLGDAQVLFDGQPARATSVQPNLITAAISPKKFTKPGKKEISIKQVSTGKVFTVGFLNVGVSK